MRLIKPQKIGYLQRSYGHGKNFYYVTTPILFFDLATSEILVENQQWGKVASALKTEALDHGLPKTCGEFLLAGHAYIYDGDDENDNGNKQTEVSVQIADKNKTLNVFGQRCWEKALLRGARPSEPETITQPIALNWKNAYGGEKHKLNPEGTGFTQQSPLPKLETTDQAIRSSGKKILPASFLPMPITWPQRAKYEGKYKGDWFEQYFPSYPPTTDLRLFNSVSDDQHIDGFFAGNETFCLTHVHPKTPQINGCLPGVTARAFLRIEDQLQELPLALDTVWFMPDVMLGALIFRGQTPVINMEALEIQDVLLGYENIQDEPKSVQHYQQVFGLRTDPDTALANVMNESQLSPAISQQQQQEKQQKIAEQRKSKVAAIRKRQQKVLDGFSDKITVSVEQLPEPELTPADDLLEEDIKSGNIDLTPILAHAAKKVSEADANAKQKLDELKQKFPQASISEPKTLSIEQAGKNLGNTYTAGSLEQQALLAQQMSIQSDDKLIVDKRISKGLRNQVLALIKVGKPLSCMNLTGADLSGLVLDNVDLTESVLTFANLAECQFNHCLLGSAALSNACLRGTQFNGCQMDKAVLFGVKGEGARLIDCKLQNSQWRGACLPQVCFKDCVMDSGMFLNCKMEHAIFNQCQFSKVTFTQMKLSDTDFSLCEFNSCIFSEIKLQMTRWYDCKFERSVMQLCKLQLALFERVTSHKWVFSTETDLSCSNWFDCECELTSFRSVTAVRLRANNCNFKQCDYSEAELRLSRFKQSKLISCIAARTDFTGSELIQCNLYKSRFRAARFINAWLTNCNFLEADLMWAQLQQCCINQCKNFSAVATRDLKRLDHNEHNSEHNNKENNDDKIRAT